MHKLVLRLGCRAVSVGYRLSPEHPFPCALRDAYTVLRWLHNLQQGSRSTCSGFMLSGDSAGGNLALVLCRLAQRGVDADEAPDPSVAGGLFERIAHLALFYPTVMEPLPSLPRMRYFLPRGTSGFYVKAYLGEEDWARKLNDERVNPLSKGADALRGLPPTTVVTGAYDPISEQSLRLVQALKEAGVDTESIHVAAACHGFLTFPPFATEARKVEQALHGLERRCRV